MMPVFVVIMVPLTMSDFGGRLSVYTCTLAVYSYSCLSLSLSLYIYIYIYIQINIKSKQIHTQIIK